MALDLLKDDELDLLDSKGIEALSDDALERLDAEEAPPPPSPITAAAEGLQRLNVGITKASKAIATPIAAPIDAAIKRIDERFAIPRVPTIQKTAEGDIQGDLFPDILSQAAGRIVSGMAEEQLSGMPELAKRGIKDVAAGVVQLGSGLGGAMRAMGFENIGQMMAKSAQQTTKELMPPDPNIVDKIAQGLGSMAAFMVPGLGISSSAGAVATVAPRLAMFLGTATSSVLEAGVEAGDVYNRVMDKTGDKDEANVAAGRSFFSNLPLIHYTNKLGWAGDQAGRLSRALESFFTEGFQEGGQEFIANFAAADPLMRGVVEAAFVGGIVGGVAGAAVHGPVTKIRQPEAPASASADPMELPAMPTAEGGPIKAQVIPSPDQIVSLSEDATDITNAPVSPYDGAVAREGSIYEGEKDLPSVLNKTESELSGATATVEEMEKVLASGKNAKGKTLKPKRLAAIKSEVTRLKQQIDDGLAEVEDAAGQEIAKIMAKRIGTEQAETAEEAAGEEFARVKVGDTVDGRVIREEIPNTSSISASLTEYEVIGLREVPFASFKEMGPAKVLEKLDKRTQKLAEQIKESGEIAPLIVVMDEKGPYILEGGHRFDALSALGAKSFPALVVRDIEALSGQAEQSAVKKAEGLSQATEAAVRPAPAVQETRAVEGPAEEGLQGPSLPRIAEHPVFIKAQADAKAAGFDVSKPEEIVKSYQDYNNRLHQIKELVQKGGTKAMSEEQVKALSAEAQDAGAKTIALEPLANLIVNGEIALPVYARKFGFRMEGQTPVDFAVQQLEKTGYDTKTAKTLAVVFEGFRVLGERAGISAHKLFDRYGVRIVKGQATGEGFSIELLEGADIQTFLARSGQLYLDVLGDIAADPAASEQVKGDYATILGWLGVKTREELTTTLSEKFARGFEAYLMEGKAPIKPMQTAFDAFKEWLGAIYKQLSALEVDLTPEVRRVFDRMLATDAELAIELQDAEKALGRARKLKAASEAQAPPLAPQDSLPAARVAVPEAEARVKKAKEKAKPIANQAKEKPGDGARILGVKRSIVESLSEIGALIESPEPMTQLKPAQLEKFSKAGLLDAEFKLTPLAREAVTELGRLKGLMSSGYLEDISISEPTKLTLKSFLNGIVKDNRFALLATHDMGWFTDGRIAFRTMKEDEAAYAPYKHLTQGHNPPNSDQVLKGTEPATDLVVGVLGVHEGDRVPTYLIQTEGRRQMVVAAHYYNFFKDRYPDAKFYAQGERLPIKVEAGGQMVGALMPMDMKTEGKYTVYAFDGTPRTVEMSKGRIDVDAKMVEINEARKKLDLAKKVHAENLKEIRNLDETPGEKTAALIAKIAGIQKENVDLEAQMSEASKSIAMLEEQAAALREEHGIQDIPVSGLVRKSRPKGGKGGGKGASKGDFAFDTPVELGGMEHIKPFRMPELVRLAYELMGKVPEIGGLRSYNGYFKGIGGGEIKLNPVIFQKPEQAAKTLAHEIGHLVDYLPDQTLKRDNLLGSLKSLQSHLANTFGTIQVTNKDLRDELMAVTMYWRPYDPATSSDSFKAYRKSARELYADAISVLFNTPGTLKRMAPKFYKGFFETLDAKPAVKLAFFELQALLNKTEMKIQEARYLDRKAMYLKAEDLWALKRKEQEARESHYGEWFKQLVVEKHQKAIGMVEAAASNGQMLPPSADPRYILEELSLADNANHAFLEKVNAKVVKPLADSEVTLLDLGDYLYLSRVAQGDRQAFANPKGYHPEEATKALKHMATRLGTERYANLEVAAASFREIVYSLSEEATEVGAYSREVFDEKIKTNRGSYAVFAVQDYLEDYIAAGVKEQIGTLKDIANPFTATVMKMVALNRLIAKQKAANVMRNFLLSRGEAEQAEALNPQDNLVQFRAKKGKGLLEMLENGKRVAYYVDPYIAEAFQKKEAGTFNLAVKILDSLFNGVFRPLYITFNIGFQLYSNPIRDFARTRRNVYALIQNEGYTGTVKSLMMAYFDSLSPAAKRSMDIPDALISEMIANKSLNRTFTDFSFDPDADQYTAVMRKMGVEPPQQNGLLDKLSKTKVLYPLAQLLEGIRFIGNTHETASKIAGYKVLKADQLKTLDKAIVEEKDEIKKKFLTEQRDLLENGEGEYAHRLAYNTRNYVGTPNWRRRGTISHITNTIFPFSNIMVQGMRSDLEIATRPETRTGFMFDMVLTQVLPKLLMFMAAMGGAGDDAEEFFRKVSEYDKSNYMVIPIGWSDDGKGGRKAVYWRVPHDESGRLIAAVAWRMMNAMRGDPKALQQIVDFGAGQLPKLAPPITIGATWLAYLSGKNPYDSFRGRPLMPDKVHQAGGRYALTSMVKWTANQFGLASFATHDPSGKSGVESMMEVTPLLNRIIKISDYGEREESMKSVSEKQAEDAALSLDRGRAAVSYTKERYILSQKLAADEISTDERKRLSRLNKYYPIYLTYTKAIKRANGKADQDKVEHYRERLDAILAKVID